MSSDLPTVAVIGASGCVGRNLLVRLSEAGFAIGRPAEADVVFLLSEADTVHDVHAVHAGSRRPLVIFASSAKSPDDAPEAALLGLAAVGEATAAVYRLPEVFGKWAETRRASAVATLCHQLARGLPVDVDDPDAPLSLLYVDDLIDQWLALIRAPSRQSGIIEPAGVHETTAGEVASILQGFAAGRAAGEVAAVGSGLERALYATFVSALPTDAFAYPLVARTDPRGSFTEVLKAGAGGQVSVLTAHPGVTRGGHYHHSKVEKFLIVHGEALFRFRNILDGETFELRTSADRPVVVETIPGWTHEVTNVGPEVMVSFLWANEVFDRERPDTFWTAS